MVTRKCGGVWYYRLHFLNMTNEEEVYENVISKNIQTLRYYVNKAKRSRNLLLMDFYEVGVFERFIWLTKYWSVYREWDHRGAEFYVSECSIFKTFDGYLGIETQTPNPILRFPDQQAHT
jgi:hypothetical protein